MRINDGSKQSLVRARRRGCWRHVRVLKSGQRFVLKRQLEVG